MTGLFYKAIIAAVYIIFISILFTGCEEQNAAETSSEVKVHRLIAAENTQLKEQLARCEAEIERQKELAAKCLQEKELLEEDLKGQLQDLGERSMQEFSEKVDLLEENKILRAQIEELKK